MNILDKLKHISRIFVQLIGMFIFACIPIILAFMGIVWVMGNIWEWVI